MYGGQGAAGYAWHWVQAGVCVLRVGTYYHLSEMRSRGCSHKVLNRGQHLRTSKDDMMAKDARVSLASAHSWILQHVWHTQTWAPLCGGIC
jgi:hypothetical protein